jgi:hypothetical protein
VTAERESGDEGSERWAHRYLCSCTRSVDELLTGVSGGFTSVDPSRSLDSEVSPVRASGHKRAEYA